MSRPATYVTWTVQSKDGKEHAVSLYFDASNELAVDTAAQGLWRRDFGSAVPGHNQPAWRN